MKEKKTYLTCPLNITAQVLFCLLLCLLVACKSASETSKAPLKSKGEQPSVKVTFPLEKCSFEKLDPGQGDPLSEYSKALLYKLGTGILKQKEGSLCKLGCSQGDSFPAWIDSDGNPVSTLYGLSWLQNVVFYSPGDSAKMRLWEKTDGVWWEIPGKFEDITVSTSSSSRASSATYCVFSNDSVSDYSARLLRYFGIGVAGKESRVKVKLGNYAGTGTVNPSGEMNIIDDASWTEKIE